MTPQVSATIEERRRLAYLAVWRGDPVAYVASEYGLPDSEVRKLKEQADERHLFAKGSRQVYSVDENENATALEVFDELKRMTKARNNADIFVKLKNLLPVIEKLLELQRESEPGIRAYVKRALVRISEDVSAVLEGVEADSRALFKMKQKEEESTT